MIVMKMLVKCLTSKMVEIYVYSFYLTTIHFQHLQCLKTDRQTNNCNVHLMFFFQPKEH